ncbi:hypothetical protein ABK040_010601 [Willaertia magna]
MLQTVKDIQNDLQTLIDSFKKYALPSEQTTANQYTQELQTKYDKTKGLEQKLLLELTILDRRCNATVGENCNFIKPSNCTTGWFGIDCNTPICFGYLPSDLNVCSGYGSCVNPDKCDCKAGRSGSMCEIISQTNTIVGDNSQGRKWSNGEMAASCNQYRYPTASSGYSYEGAVGDGVYWIKTKSVFKVWCDMSSNGGGWTLIVAQFEADPIGSWAQGLPSTYDPTLQSKKSFLVDYDLIPSHSFTGFGKDLTATTIDYFTFVYTVGDIPINDVVGFKTNANYRIFRHSNNYFANHNPYGSITTSYTSWRNTLTVFRQGTTNPAWAFSPYGAGAVPGYAFNGVYMELTYESFAWTVWVK